MEAEHPRITEVFPRQRAELIALVEQSGTLRSELLDSVESDERAELEQFLDWFDRHFDASAVDTRARGDRMTWASIGFDSARELVDLKHSRAESQLSGAVAVHNILQRERVAYLADEVGLGKTYVALTTMALMRHFQPGFRVLVIAPRSNIQRKWTNDWRSFVARNWLPTDLRVKSVSGSPPGHSLSLRDWSISFMEPRRPRHRLLRPPDQLQLRRTWATARPSTSGYDACSRG